MQWLYNKIEVPGLEFYQRALQRQSQLTKPPGSLGDLELIAARLAAMQQSEQPCVDRIWVSVFAADHGIATESVSAFPQSVTAAMVANFANGGAAVNVLAKQNRAKLEIVDVGILEAVPMQTIVDARAGRGTANFLLEKAMTAEQLLAALRAGKEAVNRALANEMQLFVGGEMGIGNTTSASAVACAILSADPDQLVGAGSGVGQDGVKRKTRLIIQALSRHQGSFSDPIAVLQCLGGFEIAALTAAYLVAAQNRMPVLIDGFIASVAALLAIKIQANVSAWFFFAHRSKEQGHQIVLDAMQARPLLDLKLCLGEASGALLAIPILQSACVLHRHMATFDQAQVSRINYQD